MDAKKIGTMIAKAVVEVYRIVNPSMNTRTREIIGTVIFWLSILVSIGTVFYEHGVTGPGTQPAPLIVPSDVLDLDDEGMDAGEVAYMIGTAPLAIMSSVLGMSCSGAQVAQWQGAGMTLAQCLASCGVSAGQDAISQWSGGAGIDAEAIGWDALPCVIKCAGLAGGVLLAGAEMKFADSVGATMTPIAKALAKPSTMTPMEAACGDWTDGPPSCAIIIYE